MLLSYKNGPPKYQCLHFYTMDTVYAIEYHPYCPRILKQWWKRCLNACCGEPCRELPHQQILTGATISIFYNKELRVRQQFLGSE